MGIDRDISVIAQGRVPGPSWPRRSESSGMALEHAALFSLGLLVGLSGAMIPGPLLAFTILDTSRKGRVTAHLIVAGHALWEAGIILLILLGFGWLIGGHEDLIYSAGGLVLGLMGIETIRGRGRAELGGSGVDSSLIGGIFYTAFNPTQPLWWATAGLALLLKGSEALGALGVALVTAGHWLSDLAYYLFVSLVVHWKSELVRPKRISVPLGLFMLALGAYFLAQGLGGLLRALSA